MRKKESHKKQAVMKSGYFGVIVPLISVMMCHKKRTIS
jgi:hypothetical protein